MRENEVFEEFINNLDKDTFSTIEKMFSSGAAHNIIQERKQKLNNPMLVCPVCESSVNEKDDLLLEFGPRSFRQKARFCGHDCLEFFLHQRKSLKQKNVCEEEYATQ